MRVDRQAEAERRLSEAGLAAWAEHGARGQLMAGATVPAIARWLVQQGFNIEEITPEHMTLEDFYLEAIRPPLSGP
jgi:hypothetical protein